MIPYFQSVYANPSNTGHQMGIAAADAVYGAKASIASHLNCQPQQVFFTAGATESNNLIIQGFIDDLRYKHIRQNYHIITSAIEHKSVLGPCEALAEEGVAISYVPPASCGTTSVEAILDAVREETVLVSLMMGNNETGVINDISGLSAKLKEKGVLLHTDATQCIGVLPINLKMLGVDFLSLSAHKIYGPKGVGAMFVRDPSTLQPVLFGGGQEEGKRPGTLNVPGIVGMAKALEISCRKRHEETSRLRELRNTLEAGLLENEPRIIINGGGVERLPHVSNISFPVKQGYNLLDIIAEQQLIACSSGSACDSSDKMPSHVMRQMGKSRHEAKNTIRFSLGRYTTEEDIRGAVSHLSEIMSLVSA